jgi:hypothetical protein
MIRKWKWKGICLVCGFRAVENTYNDYMEHILMESLYECSLCGWGSYTATGSNEESIGKYILYDGWHPYNRPEETEFALHDGLRQIAIRNTREELAIPFIHGAIAISQI